MDTKVPADLALLQSEELTGRTPFCPEDQEIVAYFHDGLAGARRDRVERHLADCRFCLARIGTMQGLQEEGADTRVPEDTLAAAKLLRRTVPGRRLRRARNWAAAAVVVLAMATLLDGWFGGEESPGGTQPADSRNESRQLRSIDRDPSFLELTLEAPRGAMSVGSSVQWPEVGDSLYYTVFVLSEDGDVLWTERTAAATWALGGELELTGGTNYFLRVEAVLPGGARMSSRHVAFRMAGSE